MDKHVENMNTDELLARMEQDDLEEAPLITPIEFAKIRPIAPQSIYYAIRTHKLATRTCTCGRKCIVKNEADDHFRKLRGPEAWPYGKERDE